jgi:imidazolonepropionase-like amidohydrolase
MATELAPGISKKPSITGPFSMMHPWARVDLDSPEVDELIKLMVKKRVYFDPTLTVIEKLARSNDPTLLNDPDYEKLDSNERKHWEEENKIFLVNVGEKDFREAGKALKVAQGFLRKAFSSGVKILAGSDNGMPYSVAGKSLLEELELLAGAGIPNIDVIRAATINAASALKRKNDLGSIEAGKIADLLILKANPLEDIQNIRKISRVIKDGAIVHA